MDYVAGISWPRSGHHMLVRLLRKYVGRKFAYCPFHSNPEGCCGQAPCARPDQMHFTKNHDFGLRLPQLEGQKYLIQYRDFVPSVVSNFELFVRQGKPDTRAAFGSFASAEFGRYRAFMDKWVRSEFAARQLVLRYEDFVAHPHDTLARVLVWFDADIVPDPARIARAVATINGERIEANRIEKLTSAGVHAGRDVTRFRHYDRDLFDTLGGLRLTRAEVDTVYAEVLSRPVPEHEMLTLQTHDTPAALRTALQDIAPSHLHDSDPRDAS